MKVYLLILLSLFLPLFAFSSKPLPDKPAEVVEKKVISRELYLGSGIQGEPLSRTVKLDQEIINYSVGCGCLELEVEGSQATVTLKTSSYQGRIKQKFYLETVDQTISYIVVADIEGPLNSKPNNW